MTAFATYNEMERRLAGDLPDQPNTIAAAPVLEPGRPGGFVKTILVVDDEEHIRELATLYLEKEGYGVLTAADGEEALRVAKSKSPDLVVLDVMMPNMDGLDTCRELRKESDVPIIMLTARSEEVDRIVGLELGADDYMGKPFNPRELAARVKAILRRSEGGSRGNRGAVSVGPLTIDWQRREVTLAGESITLRNKEFDLLRALAEHEGIVLSREQLLEQVWGYDYFGETRTVDVHVNQVRRKLGDAAVQIQTVRGVGYKLVDTSS
jgi:two-component system alkaline phosphatase synthesis response regulator PhoP